MKVCRTCHSAYPDGYQNCPKDGSRLEQQILFGQAPVADRRSVSPLLIAAAVMVPIVLIALATIAVGVFVFLRTADKPAPERKSEIEELAEPEEEEEVDAGKPDESRKGEPTDKRPEQISGGVLNGKAKKLPKPDYTPAAKAVKAEGLVTVQVLVDTKGKVAFATAVSGHPLLRSAAVKAAKAAEFAPTTLSGKPVEVSGVLTYNFVAPD